MPALGRLGLDRVERSLPPILAGFADSEQATDSIAQLSDWRPPAPIG